LAMQNLERWAGARNSGGWRPKSPKEKTVQKNILS
jgi:hypothetical protein